MKKVFFLFLLAFTAGFAEDFFFSNQTSYPTPKSKMAIQWAASAKEVQEANQAFLAGHKLQALQMISKTGKLSLTIPQNAEYFRVLVWSKGEGEPDFHTNWVDIVPEKNYTLKNENLVPSVLMSGMGC